MQGQAKQSKSPLRMQNSNHFELFLTLLFLEPFELFRLQTKNLELYNCSADVIRHYSGARASSASNVARLCGKILLEQSLHRVAFMVHITSLVQQIIKFDSSQVPLSILIGKPLHVLITVADFSDSV